MADRNQPIKAAPSKRASKKPRSVPHLKPLSIYSHKVFCKATNSSGPSWSLDCPSWNWKAELSNIRTSVGQKRRLNDSCIDETPPKKPCLISSDSGCVLDSFDVFQDGNPVSLQSSSVVYDEIKRVEKSQTDQKSLDQGWVDGSDKINVHSSSPVFVQSEDGANGFAFDYDVEEIMCLSPIDRVDIGMCGREDFSQSAPTYYQESEGHSSWYNSGQKQEKESKSTMESKITKIDEVHFMKPYYVTVPKLSRDETQTVSTPIMSTPSDKSKELIKRPPRLNHRLDLDKENWSSLSGLCKPDGDGETFSEKTDAADSFGNTLPLQVHVKSNMKTKATKVYPRPEKAAASTSQTKVPRPVALYREGDWETEKEVYVESVKRHMTENIENGVMSELLHLIDTVANQERGLDGRKWQHPSDLTRRNYRSRTDGNFFSLDEWVNVNCPKYPRFSKLPKLFKRSLGN